MSNDTTTTDATGIELSEVTRSEPRFTQQGEQTATSRADESRRDSDAVSVTEPPPAYAPSK